MDWKIGTGGDDVKSIRLILNPNYKAPQTQSKPQTQPQTQPSTVKKPAPTEVQIKTKEIQKVLGMKETGTMDQPTINKAYEIISKL